MADDKTRAKQLIDRVATSPQKFESRIREMNYYKELRDEEFLRDKEAGMSFRELQKLYGDLNTYIKRKKEEEAMEDLPPMMTIKRTKDKPAKKAMKGGGLLDDDRKMYQDERRNHFGEENHRIMFKICDEMTHYDFIKNCVSSDMVELCE